MRSGLRRCWLRLRWYWGLARRVQERLRGGHAFLLAAGIAFNVALCFIPLGLVAIWLFAAFLPVEFVEEALRRVVVEPLVPSQDLQVFVASVMEQVELVVRKRIAAGVVGIVAALWTASALLRSVRTGLHAVFGVSSVGRSFLWGRLRDLVLTVVLLGLTVVTAAVLVGGGVLAAWGAGLLPRRWQALVPWFWQTVGSVLAELVLFAFLFRWVPLVRLTGRALVVAVGSAVGLTELLRAGFVWYLENIAPWGWIYGGYAVLVALVMWAYGVALLILFSGALGAVVQEVWRDGRV